MDIVDFTRCSISDVDNIRIFKESHKKNYCKVNGKQHECRKFTLFDPIIIRYFVRKSSTKTNSSLHPILKRLNQTHKFLRTTKLQQNLPESQSIQSIKCLWQVKKWWYNGRFCFLHFSCSCRALKIMSTVPQLTGKLHCNLEGMLLTIAPINLFKIIREKIFPTLDIKNKPLKILQSDFDTFLCSNLNIASLQSWGASLSYTSWMTCTKRLIKHTHNIYIYILIYTTHTHVYIHIYLHTHTHTHIHIYIYITLYLIHK